MLSECLIELIQITDTDFEYDRVKHKADASSLGTSLEIILSNQQLLHLSNLLTDCHLAPVISLFEDIMKYSVNDYLNAPVWITDLTLIGLWVEQII